MENHLTQIHSPSFLPHRPLSGTSVSLVDFHWDCDFVHDRMGDYRRVLLGAKMVLDHAVKRMSPDVRLRLERNFTHMADLLAVLQDISRSAANNARNARVEDVVSPSPNGTSDFTSSASSDASSSQTEYGNKSTGTSSTDSSPSIGKPNDSTRQEGGFDQPKQSISHDSSHDTTSKASIAQQIAARAKAAAEEAAKVALQAKAAAEEAKRAAREAQMAADAEADLIGFNAVKDEPNPSTTTASATTDAPSSSASTSSTPPPTMRERAVPSTQAGRLFGFGSLAVRLALGDVVDRASHALSGKTGPRVLSDENAERLAESLCRMRGAALKLGQMLSIQDSSTMPPSLAKALERVKQAADYMPRKQLEGQLTKHLGENWREKFSEFDYVPIAAASIGQVHRGKLLDGTEVAIKIQYPGVAESIDSDLQNLKTLVRVTNLLPPGLFVDNIIKVASEELSEECDYLREAQSQQRYREHILADPILRKHVNVPEVFAELCTDRVLVTRLVPGINIDKALQYPQEVRNAIARTQLILAIRELFEWRFVQSDPNFANFLYDHPSKTVHLIDFGAARAYDKTFVDGYMRLVWAAANKDRQTLLDVSKDLGFITGDESKVFLDAHVEAGFVVGEPFLLANQSMFDFANSHLTQRIGAYGSTFMQYRLTPPPNEAYSLHRKLAGAFLLCIRLQAQIPCRDILEDTFNKYQFDTPK